MKDRKSQRPRPGIPDPKLRAHAYRFQGLLIASALCALTVLAYSNSFRAGMVLDSKALLVQDPRVHAATGENLSLILAHTSAWPIGENGTYRPLTTLSYLFNYAILGNGDRPEGYHWVNLLLHLGNVLLVLASGRRLLGQVRSAALLAALWAAHPASTEAVTNIIGRSDLLAAMSVLSGFLMYLKSTTARRWRMAWLVGVGLVTAAGVASKESAVMIIAVIALYEVAWPGRRQWFDLFCGVLATGIPITGILLQRSAVLAASLPAEFPFVDNPIAHAGFWTGRLTALKVMAYYLGQAVWPWRLSVDYSYNQIPLGMGSAGDWLSLGVTLLAAAGLAGLWRWNRTAFFLAGFAVVVFLPMSNLLLPIGAIRADRFLYLPTFGLLGCMVMAVNWLGSRIRRPLLAPLVLLAMTAGFAARTWARNAEWRDEFTLASADLETSPHSFKLHRLMATTLLAADSSHANIDRVVEEIDRSLAIVASLPDLENAPETYYFGGAAYLEKGEQLLKTGGSGAETAFRRARELLERCIQINLAHEQQANQIYAQRRKTRPGNTARGVVGRTRLEAYRLLVEAYQELGDMDAALGAANEAQRTNPLDPETYNQIADLFLQRKQGNEAVVALTAGVLITSDPDLRSNLLTLYGSSTDPANCAVIHGPDGAEINSSCRIVAGHMCAAAPVVLRSLMDMGRRQEALEKKQIFLNEYRCPPGKLNELAP